MWNLTTFHLKIVLVSVQERCTVCAKRTIGSEIVLTQLVPLVTRLKWKLVSVRLEIVLILTQDRCKVCAGHTIGLEIILEAPEGKH